MSLNCIPQIPKNVSEGVLSWWPILVKDRFFLKRSNRSLILGRYC